MRVAEAGDDEVQPGDADDEQHAADADAGAEVGRAEPAGDQRGDEHAHRERRVGEARLERREAEAGLEQQRDHHEEAGNAGREDGDDEDAEQEVAVADQAPVEELRLVGRVTAAFPEDEERGEDEARGHHRPDPERPAHRPALDEREDDGEGGEAEEADADVVVLEVGMARRARR